MPFDPIREVGRQQLIWWSKCDVKLVLFIPRLTEQADPLIPPNELAMRLSKQSVVWKLPE
jgi:hypothetical protein